MPRVAKPIVRLIRVGKLGGANSSALLESQLRASVKRHAYIIQAAIRQDFRKPKHGRKYKYNGRIITASAPGEAPAIRSGTLYRGIIPRFSRSGMQAMISPDVFYAGWLERGTRNMAPRPFLKKNFDLQRRAFRSAVKAGIKAAIKRQSS